jgi:hypothetical protein
MRPILFARIRTHKKFQTLNWLTSFNLALPSPGYFCRIGNPKYTRLAFWCLRRLKQGRFHGIIDGSSEGFDNFQDERFGAERSPDYTLSDRSQQPNWSDFYGEFRSTAVLGWLLARAAG